MNSARTEEAEMPRHRARSDSQPDCHEGHTGTVPLVRSVLLTLASLLLIVTTPGVASAAIVRKYDSVGDAPAVYDIRWAEYNNASTAVAYKVKVRRLTNRTAVYGLMKRDDDLPTDFSTVRVWKRATGGIEKKLTRYAGNDGWSSVIPCSGITVAWRPYRDIVRISVPRSCLADMNGRLEMGARVSLRSAGAPPYDFAPFALVRQG
jgi:hypothetical protein